MQNFCIHSWQATDLRCRISASFICCRIKRKKRSCRISASTVFKPPNWDAEFLHHPFVVGTVMNNAKNKVVQNFCIQRLQATRRRCRISASFICFRVTLLEFICSCKAFGWEYLCYAAILQVIFCLHPFRSILTVDFYCKIVFRINVVNYNNS